MEQKKKKLFGIRIDEKTLATLKRYSRRTGIPMSQMARSAIKTYLHVLGTKEESQKEG